MAVNETETDTPLPAVALPDSGALLVLCFQCSA